MADETTIQRIYQLIIDAGGSKAGADVFKAAADQISASAQKAAGSQEPLQRTTAQVEQAMQRLVLRMDPAARAQANFARDAALLEDAFRRQLLPMDQLQSRLQQLTEYHRIGEQAARRGGSAYSEFGARIQNAGFQVGDFAVQIASGQNPLRAFIQQGTQLISMFGPWGAIIGAAGAVIGALATSFTGLEESTKKATAAEEAHTKALEHSRDLYKAIRGEVEQTTQMRVAELRTTVEQAEAELRAVQARAAGTPQFLSPRMTTAGGKVIAATPNPAFKQAQADVQQALAYVQQQRAILDAALDDYDARIQKSFSVKPAESAVVAGATAATNQIKATTAAVKEQTKAAEDLDTTLNGLLANMGLLAPSEAQIELSFEQGKISADEYRKAINAVDAAHDEVKKSAPVQVVQATAEAADGATKYFRGWSNAVSELGGTFTSAFEEAVLGGAKLSTVLKGVEQDLLRIALRMGESALLTGLFGEGGFGSGGGLLGPLIKGAGSWLASLIGGASYTPGTVNTSTGMFGHLAGGGDAYAGKMYRVNENGEEFFKPDVDGTVMPLGMGGATGGGAEVNVYNYGNDKAQVASRQGPNGKEIIDIVIGKVTDSITNNGKVGQAIARSFGANRVAGAQRS